MIRVRAILAEWSAEVGSYIAVLDEVEGQRSFSLRVTEFEAQIIALLLAQIAEGLSLTPYTYALVLDKAKLRVDNVKIVRSFFTGIVGKVVIRDRKKVTSLLCTPGAAIELALRCEAPLFISEKMLAELGVTAGEPDVKREQLESLKNELQRAIDQEEYEEAAKIRDQILKLEDNFNHRVSHRSM